MIASSAEGGIDLARLLLDLLIIIGAAKVLAEIAERLKVPAVLGEILAGVIVGPSALGLIHLDEARGVFRAVAEDAWRDPDAVIFRLAHFGIVGDVHDVLPALADALRTRRPASP